MTPTPDMNSGPIRGHDESASGSGASASPHAIAMTVSYDGEPFAGFARQPAQRTVQGALEEALATALRRPVEIVGAGRTDAGVHALGQVVSFEADGTESPQRELARSVTALAAPGIVVREVRLARSGFSARFDAVRREYRYRIAAGGVQPLFLSRFAWPLTGELDLDAMRTGACALVGEHDFRSFCVTESAVGQRTMRRVESIDIFEEQQLGEDTIVVRVVGNAFLHSMVRTIVGTLAEVGLGRREPSSVAAVLAACDRSAAGTTAPARGLTLWRVEYPDDVWL